MTTSRQVLESWATDIRWKGIIRPYRAEEVLKLRGSAEVKHTLGELGAKRLWQLVQTEEYVHALWALTGNQAVQQVKAGLKAIYLSGWQVAADANLAGHMYPDQSLYPANRVPEVVRKINHTLLRVDQIHHSERKNGIYWLAPIFANAEVRFGGPLNSSELMEAMTEAGAAGIHFEYQLVFEKNAATWVAKFWSRPVNSCACWFQSNSLKQGLCACIRRTENGGKMTADSLADFSLQDKKKTQSQNTNTSRVFISYAHEDEVFARQLHTHLQRDKVQIFADFTDIKAGDRIPARIIDGLEWCDTLLLVWSEHAERSNSVTDEWWAANHLNRRIIPCVIDNTELPILIISRSFINFNNFEDGYLKLCKSLGVIPHNGSGPAFVESIQSPRKDLNFRS